MKSLNALYKLIPQTFSKQTYCLYEDSPFEVLNEILLFLSRSDFPSSWKIKTQPKVLSTANVGVPPHPTPKMLKCLLLA